MVHAMNPISDILEELRAGRIVVLVDDESRENEGDFICAAEHVTPQTINFMLREARGVLCLALSGDICDRLDLRPQSSINTSLHATAFTVTIDAHERFGVSTGVSAADRATTMRVAIDEQSVPADLVRPGHINPLRARVGGSLVRAGQTEGSVDLCRLAGLKPAAAIIEIMNEDGSMARLDDLKTLCARHNLKMCSVADVIQYRLEREKLIERVDEASFESEWGRFHLIAYRSAVDSLLHVALVCGELGRRDATGQPVEISEPVLVRMHSQNLLGDVLGDVGDPTGRVLRRSMQMIQQHGRGAIVYLRHEGMGKGLLKRLQTLHDLAHHPPRDEHSLRSGPGDYGIGSQILRDLGIRKLQLLTNHPVHPTALSGFGLEISEFVPVEVDGAAKPS